MADQGATGRVHSAKLYGSVARYRDDFERATTVPLYSAPNLAIDAAEAAGPVDGVPPVITITSPTPGTNINIDTPLVGTITDAVALGKVVLAVRFPNLGRTELVYNGTSLQAPYNALSSLNLISGGFSFSIRRTGGWPVPTTGTEMPELLVLAFDASGNEGV